MPAILLWVSLCFSIVVVRMSGLQAMLRQGFICLAFMHGARPKILCLLTTVSEEYLYFQPYIKVECLSENLRKQMVYVGAGSKSAVLVKSNKQSDVTQGIEELVYVASAMMYKYCKHVFS